jgi:hypothetical protein
MPPPQTKDPLCPGLYISQKGFGMAAGGTLGCFMTDNKSGGTVLVSNQHVLAFYQPSWWPSQSEKDAGVQVIQPDGSEINAYVTPRRTWLEIEQGFKEIGVAFGIGLGDTEDGARNRLAELIADRCVVATVLRGQLGGNLDVAVAALKPGIQWTNQLEDGTTTITAPPRQDSIAVGTRVGKWGARSNCWKTGTITALGVQTTVPFASTNQKTLPCPSLPQPALHKTEQLSDLIEVTGDGNGVFQMQGDSGSALCTADGHLIGILSSGGLGPKAYAIPIWTVIKEFGLSFP